MIKGNFNKFSREFLAVFHKCARAQGERMLPPGYRIMRSGPFPVTLVTEQDSVFTGFFDLIHSMVTPVKDIFDTLTRTPLYDTRAEMIVFL